MKLTATSDAWRWLPGVQRLHHGGIGRGAGDGRSRGLGVRLGGVGEHGGPWHQLISMESTRQPSPAPLLSLAIRQRRVPSIIMDGSLTVVVMKPPELPLQA